MHLQQVPNNMLLLQRQKPNEIKEKNIQKSITILNGHKTPHRNSFYVVWDLFDIFIAI